MNQLPELGNFEALLEFLHRTRGFDFSAYKLSSLQRRIVKRMKLINIEHYEEYIDYLEVHTDEFSALFNTILINVTSFFRDRPVWDYVASDILPRIISAKPPGDPIRVWSAGCASGEEAYSAAMLLAEQLGQLEFSRRVKIYATDVDEEALNQARQASYSALEVEEIPPALRDKYFDQQANRYLFSRDLRRSVIFGRNDLIQDAPISCIDLLICRNTLMYLNAEAQSKILARFNFALNAAGFLFLGKAEAVLTHAALFTPVDLKRRIFTKVIKSLTYENGTFGVSSGLADPLRSSPEQHRPRELALEFDPVAHLLIDQKGLLTMADEAACQLFNLTTSDLGRPYLQLDLAFHPPDLPTLLEQIRFERRTRNLKEVEWESTSLHERRYLDIFLIPLLDGDDVLGVELLYYDVTPQKRLQAELPHYNRVVGTANEELQSSKKELEATNEELHSAVGELQTTNEELQSTNEEMETMNEELQAINEELGAANDALRQRSEEMNHLNAFLNAILSSLREGVVVVDREFQVMSWNNHAQEMWGLRPDEVQGKNFLSLDFGLPVEALKPIVRGILAGNLETRENTVAAVNRRGKPIQVLVSCVPFQGTDKVVRGVILILQELRPGLADPNGKDGDTPGASS
jgi:two-component system CheB/CheR fusion protein